MALHLVPRALQYLEQVAQFGSIQAASRDLGISASAIHRQITAIEDALGEALFEREARGMTLTPAGRLVLEMAREWRLDNARLWSAIEADRGVAQGHFRIAAMDSMVNGLLPALVAEIARAFPRVTAEIDILSPDNAVKGVLNGDYDIAAVANADRHESLAFHWFREFPLGCIATPDHPLARQQSVGLQGFIAHPVVFQSAALSIRKLLEARHGWIFEQAKTSVVVSSIQLMKQLVATGRYVAVTSELDAAPEILAGRLIFVPISDPGTFSQTISLISNARMPRSALCHAVIDIAVEELDRLSPGPPRTEVLPGSFHFSECSSAFYSMDGNDRDS